MVADKVADDARKRRDDTDRRESEIADVRDRERRERGRQGDSWHAFCPIPHHFPKIKTCGRTYIASGLEYYLTTLDSPVLVEIESAVRYVDSAVGGPSGVGLISGSPPRAHSIGLS